MSPGERWVRTNDIAVDRYERTVEGGSVEDFASRSLIDVDLHASRALAVQFLKASPAAQGESSSRQSGN